MKMTINTFRKRSFLSQLAAHKENKNLFEAENLNIDSKSFQESKIYDKTIFSVFVHCRRHNLLSQGCNFVIYISNC